MTSPDGRFVIVYNGELANAAELRAALDWSFRSRTDTEVTLAAFARWGPSSVARLSGMFAFFVWDVLRERGFGARDRLGVKPLHFARAKDRLVFASEAHAIARTGDDRARMSTRGVLEVLVAPCFSGVAHGMFEGVTPLLPGTTLTVDRDGTRTASYWDWPSGPGTAHDDDPVRVVDSLRQTVPAAVRRALVADVPIGLFSSGGLDSTILASVLLEERRDPVDAFTVTFDAQARFDYARSSITGSDDTPFARAVAEQLGLRPRWVHVARDTIAEELRTVAITNDALPAWEQELAQHRLARAAAETLKVVLVGDAADETHYGYHFLLDREAVQGPAVVLRRLGSVPIRKEIASDPVGDAARELESLVAEAGGRFDGGVAAMTWLIVKRWLPRLLHNGDIHTMRASLEARVPFADAELVELAARVAPCVALRDGVEKWALREAMRGRVPELVRTRKKSALPKDLAVEPVFREEAAKVVREPPLAVAALVDLEVIDALLATRRALTEPERAVLFRVITFAHWARHHEVPAP
jgi:asparagine synthase (glutamine-hydrolysing)